MFSAGSTTPSAATAVSAAGKASASDASALLKAGE
jgi:hypothetical protein